MIRILIITLVFVSQLEAQNANRILSTYFQSRPEILNWYTDSSLLYAGFYTRCGGAHMLEINPQTLDTSRSIPYYRGAGDHFIVHDSLVYAVTYTTSSDIPESKLILSTFSRDNLNLIFMLLKY